jgi:hypothetical protein
MSNIRICDIVKNRYSGVAPEGFVLLLDKTFLFDFVFFIIFIDFIKFE